VIRALVEQTFDASKKYLVLAGLSTDSKPTTGIVTGSKFIEVDTGTNYAFDEVSGTWSAATITMQDIKDEIDSWLENNIDPDSGYALDRTLSLENAAAPADMVGDLKSALNDISSTQLNFVNTTGGNLFNKAEATTGKYISNSGNETTQSTSGYSNYIPVTQGDVIRFTKWGNGAEVCQLYNSEKTWVQATRFIQTAMDGYIEVTIPSGCYYATINFSLTNIDNVVFVKNQSYDASYAGTYGFTISPKELYKLSTPELIDINNSIIGISKIDGFLGFNNMPDILNTGSLINKEFVATNGTITSTTNTQANRTDYIDVSAYVGKYFRIESYEISAISVIAFYDENHDVIGTIPGTASAYTLAINYIRIPETAKYAIFSVFCPSEIVSKLKVYLGDYYLPKMYEDIEYLKSHGPTSWSGCSANFLGDSITYGLYTPVGGQSPTAQANPTYVQTVKEFLDLEYSRNYGSSGTCISSATSQSPQSSFVNRYSSMESDADIVVVFGGTNDYGTSVPMGDPTDTTDTSFYGSMDVLCKGLIAKYLGKRIVFITPIPRNGENTPNSAGKTLQDYRDAIVDVAQNRYGLAIIDGRNLGISTADSTYKATYIVDGLHPTQLGHDQLGKAIAHILNAI
jgi:lysophospholipase L1-like esterase